MARLSSERLRLHITDVITWTIDGRPFYENFKIKLTIHGRETLPNINGHYELCDGNIEYLIHTINESLEGKEYTGCEFTEPDFNFEIKRYEARKHQWFGIDLPESYDFIVWVNSGNWNGVYSATEVGHKLHVTREQLVKFRDGLQQEWDKRQVLEY